MTMKIGILAWLVFSGMGSSSHGGWLHPSGPVAAGSYSGTWYGLAQDPCTPRALLRQTIEINEDNGQLYSSDVLLWAENYSG